MAETPRASPAAYVARRRARRRDLIARARRFAEGCQQHLPLRAAVVFGSVARGDWNDESDIDVLVVADGLPAAPLARLAAVGEPEDRVEPVVWSVTDWRRERARGNPIVTDALAHGVWLVGGPAGLGGDDPPR
ncbi:MAG TPA: nucleotidyltransferase domain-containing protein [Egibacteraceae bacterium]|jgi:uncharacterized protein|nr:nucleotidyltransferase domain-containing protein [Egibacteraceae bacterium]